MKEDKVDGKSKGGRSQAAEEQQPRVLHLHTPEWQKWVRLSHQWPQHKIQGETQENCRTKEMKDACRMKDVHEPVHLGTCQTRCEVWDSANGSFRGAFIP